MAKVKTERMIIRDKNDRQDVLLDFKFDINVNVDGEFTTTLSEDIVILFEGANIDLETNGRRGARKGFFIDKTMNGLCMQIKNICNEYISREMISETIVLSYVIQTTCAYCINDDGEVVPNGNWVKDFNSTKEKSWKHGSLDQYANNPRPFGFLVYVKPKFKQVYKYKSGKIKTEYVSVRDDSDECRSMPNLKYLSSIVSIKPPEGGTIKEVEYNENIGEFFVSIIKSICMLNEKIKDFTDPESIKLMADNKSKIKLLG